MKYVDSTTRDMYVSEVTVRHRGKEYTATAKLHPDDHWSPLTGCRYAEMRAEIKALKEEYKEKKAKCEECRKFVKGLLNYKNFDKTSPTAKVVFRYLNTRIREVNKLAEQITAAELQLKASITMQNKITKNFNQN